jgi:predicted nucleic acid-binding protein
MIETDVLYAYVKKEDWLKETAKSVISRIVKGEFGDVFVSRESLHELYHVSKEEGVSISEIINRCSTITGIKNLRFLETTFQIDLLAITLIRQYGFTSVFDAYYAATALNQVNDHTIVSTDTVFECVPGLIRIDPRKIY